MKKQLVLGVGLMLGLSLFARFAQAADFMAPSQEDRGSITIDASATHKNLYVAGGTVTVDSSTGKDLFTAGGTVVINGAIEQDLVAAGGNVTINGAVGSNARVAGGTLVLNAPIAGDLLAAGGTLTIAEKAAVAGDLAVAGGTVTLNAPVSGSAKLAGGTIYINSKISGDVIIRANKDVTFGPKADVMGKITYYGNSQAVVKDGAKVSSIDFYKLPSPNTSVKGFIAGGFIVQLLAWILAALLLVKFFPRKGLVLMESMQKHFWPNLGIGFLGIIAVPIASILLLIVLVGYFVAFAAMLWYFLLIMFACILSSIFLGALIVKFLTKRPDLAFDWQAVLIGVVIMRLVMFIPVLGWLVCAVLFFVAFGALLRLAKQEMANS